MAHIDYLTDIIMTPINCHEQDMEDIIEKMEALTIGPTRKRGRPKQYHTDEEKANRQREYSKRYYYKNQENVLNRIRAYKDANQDIIKERAKEYYQRRKQYIFLYLHFFFLNI